MDEVEPTNWSVAQRIDPPLRGDEPFQYGFETQRGCVFKCQFCTYRTLALPNIMRPEHAIERIFAIAGNRSQSEKGYMLLLDSTATFPLDRFETLMKLAIDRGGFPCPIELYARVNDITEHTAELERGQIQATSARRPETANRVVPRRRYGQRTRLKR